MRGQEKYAELTARLAELATAVLTLEHKYSNDTMLGAKVRMEVKKMLNKK